MEVLKYGSPRLAVILDLLLAVAGEMITLNGHTTYTRSNSTAASWADGPLIVEAEASHEEGLEKHIGSSIAPVQC